MMNLVEIKRIAAGMNIDPESVMKAALIKAIQRAEGNFDCYATVVNYCDQEGCRWRAECFEASRAMPAALSRGKKQKRGRAPE